MTNTFKSGDKVVLNLAAHYNNDLSRGQRLKLQGVLTVLSAGGGMLTLRAANNTETFGWYAYRFKLAETQPAPAKPLHGVTLPVPPVQPEASKQWIISLLNADGSLAPAEKPKPYTSRAQADRVAKDMATKHAGQTFVVFEAVSVASIPAPIVQLKTL